jgi:hypothetical protein
VKPRLLVEWQRIFTRNSKMRSLPVIDVIVHWNHRIEPIIPAAKLDNHKDAVRDRITECLQNGSLMHSMDALSIKQQRSRRCDDPHLDKEVAASPLAVITDVPDAVLQPTARSAFYVAPVRHRHPISVRLLERVVLLEVEVFDG